MKEKAKPKEWTSEDKLIKESLKKCYENLKTLGDPALMTIEDSAWRFMIFYTLIEMFKARERRGDQRVVIAGNTGLERSSPANLLGNQS